MRQGRFIAIFLIGVLSLAGNIYAQDDLKLLGAGVVVSTSPYKGADHKMIPVPLAVWSYKDFYLRGLEFGYRFYDRGPWALRVLGSPRMMGYDSGDSDALAGMQDRESSFDAGLGAEYELPFARDFFVEGRIITDISGRHDGQEAELALARKFKARFWRLTLAGGVRAQSAQMTDYYYGVRADEATAARPEYEAGTAVNYFTNVAFFCGISRNWVIVTRLSGEVLGNEVRSSPIVDEDVLFSGMLGLARRF